MGQKTHPFGFRVGVTEAHKSRWYAPKALYAELLVEDYRIRQFVDRRLNRTPPFAAVSDILIERTREELGVLRARPEWASLRAVRSRRVFVTDGNQYFNRPGPRLVDSLEILTEILHPDHFAALHHGLGWQAIAS